MDDKVQSIMALVHGYALAFANVCQADEATVRQRIENKDALAAALESAIREAIAAPGVAQPVLYRYWNPGIKDWNYTTDGSVPNVQALVLVTTEQHIQLHDPVSIKGGPDGL